MARVHFQRERAIEEGTVGEEVENVLAVYRRPVHFLHQEGNRPGLVDDLFDAGVRKRRSGA
jgi:hypothetical protein